MYNISFSDSELQLMLVALNVFRDSVCVHLAEETNICRALKYRHTSNVLSDLLCKLEDVDSDAPCD